MKRVLAVAVLLLAGAAGWLFIASRSSGPESRPLAAEEGSGGASTLSPRAAPTLIRGSVTHRGVPVVDAEVLALPVAEADQAGCDGVSRRLEALRARAAPLASVRTGPDGSFAVELGPPFRLVALVPAQGLVGQVLVDTPATVEVALAAGQFVRGTAVDHEGRRLDGVTVFAESDGVVLSAAADQSAGFEIGPLPSGVAVAAARRGDLIGFSDVRAESMNLILHPASRLNVVVRRGAAPAPGAAVELSSSTCSSVRTTDARGEVWFEEVAQQPMHLTAVHDGWAAAVDTQVREPVARVLLTLQPAGLLEGIVRSEGGEPVPGAEIAIAPAGRSGEAQLPPPPSYRKLLLTAGEDGRFRSESLPIGMVEITGSADGFATARLPAHLLGPGSNSVDIILAAAASIRGRVVGQDGHPAAGVSVEAWRVDVASYDMSRIESPVVVASTGEDGTFELQPLGRQPYTVRVESPAGTHAPLVVDAPREDLVISLGDGGRVAGRVVDESGGAVAGVRVELSSLLKGPGARFHRQVTSDGAGQFALNGIPSGELELHAESSRDGAPLRASQYVSVHEGSPTEVTVRLAGRLSLSGQVRTASGSPVRSATIVAVTYEDKSRPPLTVRSQTDGDGRFELINLQPGPYHVATYTESVYGGPVVGQAGGAAIELVVADMPVVSGRVVDPTGAPVVTFTVDGATQNDPDGQFRAPMSGSTVVIAAPGYAPAVLTLDAQRKGGGAHLGEVVLKMPRQIVGRVIARGSGAPVVGAEVLVAQANGMPRDTSRASALDLLPATTTGADGQFTLGATEGDVPIVIRHPKYQPFRQRLAANADRIDAELDPGATVRGRLLDASGGPAQGAVFFDGPTPDMVRTRTDGTFEVNGLAAGTYFAEARRLRPGGWRTQPRQTFTISAGAEVNIEIREPANVASLAVNVARTDGPIPDLLLVRADGAPAGTDDRRVINGQPERDRIWFRYVTPGAYALVVAENRGVVQPRVDLLEPKEYQLRVELTAHVGEEAHPDGHEHSHEQGHEHEHGHEH